VQRGAVGDRKNTQWKKVLATRPNKLHDYKLTIFPLTFERYISLPFRVGGGILMASHHYMPDFSP